ncbi:MAG: DNA-binding protein [Caldilinea sp. CFX5]|nr:DNA-binding protein [Caldilinea sp. CFX5]
MVNKASPFEHKVWFSVSEACDYLGVSKVTLYAYMKDRRLPYYYLAGTRQRRIQKTDLEALLVPGNPDEVDQEEIE